MFPSVKTQRALESILARIVEDARVIPYKQGEGTQFFRTVPVNLLNEARLLLGLAVDVYPERNPDAPPSDAATATGMYDHD